MSMLLIDAGNSCVKWVLAERGAWLQQGTLENVYAEKLPSLFSELPAPRRILASNVAGEMMAQPLRAACGLWPNSAFEFIAAQAEQCGVRNLYEHAAQLGSDRWASLIAAWHLQHAPCLVVNCGTATTVDALSGEGEFLGGLILPGMQMMQHALTAGTAQLTKDAGVWCEFPRTTANATFTGAIRATVGAIRLQFEALSARGAARCLISGGAASLVEPHLKLPLARVDNMVLRGLEIIGRTTGA